MKKLLLVFVAFLFCLTANAQQEKDIFDKFESKFVEIDGYKINLEVLGEGDPIFFLPGGPGNSHDYMQGNFGQYYRTHKVVFFDWLGRGKSEDAKNPQEEYSVAADVELIEKIRKHLGLGKISLVGHSYGTVPAQGYAIKYPDNVDKLLLIAGFHSGAMWQANCDSYNHYAKTHFPEEFAKVDSLRKLGYVSTDSELQRFYWNIPSKYVYYHDVKLDQNVPKERFRGMSLDVYNVIIGRDGDFDVSGSMIDTDFRKDLKNVKAKTLVTAGRYDGVSTPEWNVQYKIYMPQAEFVMFENSAHNPYLEEKSKFYKLFDKFFEVDSRPWRVSQAGSSIRNGAVRKAKK